MVTEGTYPQAFGGVSVWCDQLVRGLPRTDFDVYAISVTGREPDAWELPDSVTVHHVPLWGPAPRQSRRSTVDVADAHRALIRSLLAPPGEAEPAFAAALRRLCELAPAPMPAGDAPVRWLLDAWRDSSLASEVDVRPSILDALTCVDIVGHWLRPLLRPAPVADVCHAVTNGLAALPALAAKWTRGTPLLLTEHGVYLRERYLGLRAADSSWPVKAVLVAFQRLLCTAAYREADLITPGNRYNHRWETRFGALPERIRTVYNGVDPADFPPAGREPAVPTITWAGRVDPIKDLETLIRSFALVREQIPDARLRIFGGTPAGARGYHDRCVALAAELGAADAVTFEGRVANIRDAYAAGHVVVLSSISEGFPYTLIEAMTSGRATVSTDVGGVAEAVADTGFVVPPRDPAAMAERCVTLLRDELLRHRLGAAARDRALQNFTVDQAVDAFDEIYADLAGLAAAPAVAA
ncbi:lipopolysaccharide glycosyltransferase, putative [Spirilliplanes yamanashiensis]|uniref:Lipopolysaccharide glycosyltransferase, putative n=2 Tax=Spirilliplanes yamanashiensis TaxID=42233 RepID=A0A8J4DIW2_9ACTN|nr:lipopolysaccharide glycosyltransferase, putative [Spirilliplanes yamanashiensis]